MHCLPPRAGRLARAMAPSGKARANCSKARGGIPPVPRHAACALRFEADHALSSVSSGLGILVRGRDEDKLELCFQIFDLRGKNVISSRDVDTVLSPCNAMPRDWTQCPTLPASAWRCARS